MTSVWALDISSTHKLVLLALADNANDEGMCWPSMATIVAKTSLSERCVRGVIRELESAGRLLTHQRNGYTSYYTVTQPLPDPGTSCPPPAPDAPLPRHVIPGTPAPRAPRIFSESSSKPSEEKKPVSPIEKRIPGDFELTDARRIVALEFNLDPPAVFAKFKAYYLAAPDATGLRKNWDSAWRSWCRMERPTNSKVARSGAGTMKELLKRMAL